MMTKIRTYLTSAALAVALTVAAVPAHAQDAQTCQPGILDAFNGPHHARYQTLISGLVGQAGNLIGGLATTVDQATYANLLADAVALANSIPTGRVLITLPDGTVVLDTSRNNNTYANFLAKTINENHNSRIAILAAQQYQCGLGLESKLSTTTGQLEAYFALRAGNHLDSYGTIRFSSQQ